MFSILVAALLTQQVLTQTPCYAKLAGLCSDPPKHTMIVVQPPEADGAMPIQQEEPLYATAVSLRARDRLHQ
jgi:hypothetical protein